MTRSEEKRLKKELAKKHACYVLITCQEASCDGQMRVEMSYEGDATLAAFILQGAQMHIDENHFDDSPLNSKEQKIHYLK